MRVTDAWQLLGLAPTEDGREVKRAYARLLKQIDVHADPDAFIRLRAARELALRWGAEIPEWERETDENGANDDSWSDDALDWNYLLADGLCLDANGDLCRPGQAAPAPTYRPTTDSDKLRAAVDSLEAALNGDFAVDPQQVEIAGIALLELCAEAQVDEAARIEEWLLAAMAAAIPRSDPLIDAAARQFGWNDAVRSHGRSFNLDLDDLLRRRTARAEFASWRVHPGEEIREAVAELTRPGRTRLSVFDLGLARQVQRFLANVVAAQPMIEYDFAPDTLAWWRRYLAGRRLPLHFWSVMLVAPLVTTLLVVKLYLRDDSPAAVVASYAGSLAATLLAILLYAELRFRAAAREAAWDWRKPEWRRAVPWFGAAMLMAPSACLFAVNAWTAGAWNGAALIVAVGGAFNTRAPIDPEDSDWLVPPGFPGVALLACASAALAMPALVAVHFVGPAAALCFLAYRGHEAASIGVEGSSRGFARALVLGAGMLILASAISMFAFLPALPPPALLAVVPVVVAGQHLATGWARHVRGAEWGARAAAILFYLIASRALFGFWATSALASILLYALGYGVLRTLLAYAAAESLGRR